MLSIEAASGVLTFLAVGYLATVAVEIPVLLAGLPSRFRIKQRIFFGFWLTACSYPVVVLVLPFLFAGQPRISYLIAAETFAPVSESVLFWILTARGGRSDGWSLIRPFGVIVAANLLSFLAGELIYFFIPSVSSWFAASSF